MAAVAGFDRIAFTFEREATLAVSSGGSVTEITENFKLVIMQCKESFNRQLDELQEEVLSKAHHPQFSGHMGQALANVKKTFSEIFEKFGDFLRNLRRYLADRAHDIVNEVGKLFSVVKDLIRKGLSYVGISDTECLMMTT